MPLIILCLSVFLIVSANSHAEPISPMEVVEDEFAHKVILNIHGCRASLERPKNNPSYLHFRHACGQSLQEKSILLISMIEILVPDFTERSTIHTLFVGRLLLTFPDIAQRVAKAASELTEWDPQRAWKEPGYSNRIFFQLLKQPHIFQEIKGALATFGYEVQVAWVEKVLMAEPKDLLFGAWLLAQGADPKTKLPFDAMVWFNLSNPVHR